MTTKQEFNCVFCKDIFDNKEELQEHFRKHGDPKYKNRFERDTQASDVNSKEKAGLVSCDVCAQVFPTISKAITHKHKVHPDHDAKYFCPWCGKLFTMKHLYNVHVESNHGKQEKSEGKRFRCDSCTVDFYNPSAMINHNKFFHRQDTDLPDIGQSKKVKFYEQEVISIYYCAFCGEEYENKVNLIKHTTDDHGDENQSPDEVLKCPMCEAVFYHLDAYEIHLTFHSSEDMYSVKNPEYSDLLDYSLETVPPIIEKVENIKTEDPTEDTEAESTMNAVGIEKFLELAMDQSEDSNPVKAKKHKKRKKSKKSAITLDEFLSMNQDVFGEDLDFQGVEEIPTRIVKKQLKNNKKTSNSMVTSAELDKLKKAGIVVKKKVSRNPVTKGLKLTNSVCNKNALNNPVYKLSNVRGIETSSEVLTKLMNQSNNQIKIVKKVNPNPATNEFKQIKNSPSEEAEEALDNMGENTIESNCNIEEISTPILKPDCDISSSTLEKSIVIATTDDSLSNKSNIISDVSKDTAQNMTNNNENMQRIAESTDSGCSPKPVKCNAFDGVNAEDPEQENLEKNELDQFNSDTDLEDTENKFGSENCVNKVNLSDGVQQNSDNNSNNDSIFNASASSLSTLKHLSHLLTVKSVSQNRNNLSTEPTSDKMIEANSQPSLNDNKEISSVPLTTDGASLSKPKNIIEKMSTMAALKTLNKNITIKSLSTKRNIDNSESEDDEMAFNENITSNLILQNVSCNKNMTIKKAKIETSELKLNCQVINSSNSLERKCIPVKQPITKSPVLKKSNNITMDKVDNLPTTNANILRRLTNITSKPIVKTDSCPSSNIKQANFANTITETAQKKDEIIEIFDVDDSEDEEENSKQPQPTQNSVSMDALKNLSKNITIKSMNQHDSEDEEENSIPSSLQTQPTQNSKSMNALKNLSMNITVKSMNQHDSENEENSKQSRPQPQPTQNSKSMDALKNLSKNITIKSMNQHDSENKEENSKQPLPPSQPAHNSKSMDALKNLSKNITIKSMNHHDSDDEEENSKQPLPPSQPTQNSKSMDALKNLSKNITIKSMNHHDSGDEEENSKQSRPQPQPTQNTKSMDALRNLSKNITIKSMNQQSPHKNIKIENTTKNIKINKEDNNSQKKIQDESNIDALIKMQNRSNALKNVLQGLCKNITIKSRNTSPSQFSKSEEYDSKVFEDNEASDSDSGPGNVKITELDEEMEHDSNNEDDSERTETFNPNSDHPIVESPKESCSENEDEELHDFETDIKVSTVQKSSQSMNSSINSVCLNNLKNINNSITIKSLNKNSTDKDDKVKKAQTRDKEEIPQTKQLPTKTGNQVIRQQQNDNINRTSKNANLSLTQSWNKKACAMNQVNTVNKEVTVKTIQTKTVIQEITTTVTKTIKTVNQTMKQEVRQSLQTNTPMISQRIQGVRPSQSKNLQGVVIRHAAPMLGVRASNTIAQIRPSTTTVRPSNQIVPVRTGINVTRPNNPRMAMSAGKKVMPSPSSSNQMIGRPIKIAPTAMAAKPNIKRSNTEDVSGPFSCFKKPKESLIPVSDIPSFVNSGGEGSAQFTSASHTSSSNFTSTTKIVKGNSVVTAKQMKSEVSSTSQQLNMLSNKTGLKIITSQQKQSHVQQEHSESSPMRRTTLEAIQRLQQQGLLVKKPRVEVNEASEGSDHDDDNNVGYSSTDEHDN